MALKGTTSLSCGTGSYKIIAGAAQSKPSKQDMDIQQRKCYKFSEHGEYKAVDPGTQLKWSTVACSKMEFENARDGVRPKHYPVPDLQRSSIRWFDQEAEDTHVNMHFEVSWDDDCELESGAKTLNIQDPRADQTDKCWELMHDNFEKCTNNNGSGGEIQVGCLKYAFYPKP